MKHTEYKELDDGTWFAEIPGFDGVWANAATVEACRSELEEALAARYLSIDLCTSAGP